MSEPVDEQLQRDLQLLLQRHAEFSRRLEALMAQLPASAAAPGAPNSSNAPALQATSAKDIARLNDRIARMEEQFDALWRQLGVNAARIQEILDSRTWKAFTGMGGVLLRLTGRRQ
jgi:phage shock protein A